MSLGEVNVKDCPLCEADGGLLVFRHEKFRIIQADEVGFPAFYRVVWTQHVAEFSGLSSEDRNSCMNAVVLIEKILRRELQPFKVNLAALGNVVPHLHWHVIARFDWDSHFPAPVWATPLRPVNGDRIRQVAERCQQVNRLIAKEFGS